MTRAGDGPAEGVRRIDVGLLLENCDTVLTLASYDFAA
jgi:hypothetical protein